jgi:hypothetical protein
MMLVEYPYRYAYRDYAGSLFPFFIVTVRNPSNNLAVEQDAFLDSGASRSIFQGEIARMLDLDLLAGEAWSFRTATREVVQARIHDVQIVLPDTEDESAPPAFNVSLAFSLRNIERNLLGRDFFNLVQLGFREHRSEFFLEPSP